LLIVPAHKPLNRRNFPYVTFALLLVNVWVFVLFQTGDYDVRQRAGEFYLDSSLPRIEWSAYERFVKVREPGAYDRAQRLDAAAGKADGDATEHYRTLKLALMQSNRDFQLALRDEALIGPGDPDYESWRQDRDRYESILDSSFTQRHLLHYDRFSIADLFTHQFLHGGPLHLLGNMVFLVMLGLLVEGALGGGLFLAAYLVSGLGAGLVSLAVHWGEPTGSLGASGAIAGLMGLYAVLYNTRPVRFFYWAFVYFDYVKKPAILLLPLWLGWEVLQFALDGGGGVAYEAHAGGIVTGAVLGALVLLLGLERRDFLDEEVKRDEHRELAQSAMEDLSALKVDAAKSKLRRLLPDHGEDPELLRAFYAACKLKRGDTDLHDAARRVFGLRAADPAARALIVETAEDYRVRANPVDLPAGLLAGLVSRLIAWGHREAAEFYLGQLSGVANQAMAPEIARLERALEETRHAGPPGRTT